MLSFFKNTIFSSPNKKILDKYQVLVNQINGFESDIKKLQDFELKSLTKSFKEQLNNGMSLDAVLPKAFAAVREAAIRTLGQRHYDVQLLGGIALHNGKIAEMKTG